MNHSWLERIRKDAQAARIAAQAARRDAGVMLQISHRQFAQACEQFETAKRLSDDRPVPFNQRGE